MSDPERAATQPLTMPFRMLLDEAAKVSRRHVRTLFLPMSLFLALLKGLSAIVQVVWMQDYLGAIESGDIARMLPSLGGMGCLSLVVALVTLFAYAVLWATALDAVAGRPVSLRARVRWVLKPRVFGTVLILVVCIVFGLMACLLPGYLVASILVFAIAAMTEEGLFGTEAMGRSSRLTLFNPRERFLETPAFKAFVLIFVASMIAYGLSAIVQVPVALAQQLLILRDSTGDAELATAFRWVWLSIPAQIFAGFTSAAVQLYLAMGTALLYFDVRRRVDGWDLEAALDEIAPESPPSGDLAP